MNSGYWEESSHMVLTVRTSSGLRAFRNRKSTFGMPPLKLYGLHNPDKRGCDPAARSIEAVAWLLVILRFGRRRDLGGVLGDRRRLLLGLPADFQRAHLLAGLD